MRTISPFSSGSPSMTDRAASAAAGPSISSRFGASHEPVPRADLINPAPLTRAQRTPRMSASGRCGTLRFSTVRTGASTSIGRSATARSAADSHGWGSSPARRETASALIPSWLAVSAAPTVPEWSTERPTLTPWLMPERTRSGFGPDGTQCACDH